MKRLSQFFPVLSSLFFLSASIALTGCGGALNLPDSVASTQVAGPPMSGKVLGGHAPIVGAHVYLLQPGTTGIGSLATSILGNNGATSANGYALTPDTSDPFVPVGSEYVTTDSTGGFSLTGAYTCTANQPVYIYAYGGAPSTGTPPPATTTYYIQSVTVSNAKTPTPTFAFTLTTTVELYAGETVTLGNFVGNFSAINGAQVVLPEGLTTTTFEVTVPITKGQFQNKTYSPSQVGNGTVTTTANSPIVELATLGNCPSSGNFSTPGNGALTYVYMNEVSTVATAYTFQPFASASNTNAWNIGSSGTTQGLLGMANAANTAAQLYNIQGGGQISTTFDGEGHIANATTVAGNGVVPQATIDTLANILAACIDSASIVSNGTVTPSAQCSTLFSNATDDGLTTGTPPIDTASAAINIARYPAGNHASTTGVNASFVTNIFGIPTGSVPFAPYLTSAPNDFTIAIGYTGGGIGATGGQSPHAVAIDASGNVYTTNFGGNKLAIFSPVGAPASTSGFGANLNGPGSVAIDSTSSYVWLVNYASQNVSSFTTAGANEAEFPTGQTQLRDAQIDGSGNIWVTSDSTSALIKLNSAGTILSTTTTNLISPFSLSIQPGPVGSIWVADETQNEASAFTSAGAVYPGSPFTTGGIHQPTGTAIDATGNVWFANSNGTVSALTTTGTALSGSPFATGNTNYSDGIAIDGANRIWVTNSLGQTLYALTDTGSVISPSTGYLANPATQPDGIAIDPSGNIWYDSYSAAVLYEVVGAAAPTVTPLSYAVANSKLGVTP
jgi:sugar lactone lactonase YvrE